MPRPRFPGYRKCLEMMRNRNPQVQEDGFHWLRPHAAEFVEELLKEFHNEADDVGLRRWLLELIGEARNPRAFDLLLEQLASDNAQMKTWAITGLRLLDTPESRKALFDAGVPKQAR